MTMRKDIPFEESSEIPYDYRNPPANDNELKDAKRHADDVMDEIKRRNKEQRELSKQELKEMREQDALIEREANRIKDAQDLRDFKEMERKNRDNAPYEPKKPLTLRAIGKKVGDKVGGVIVQGTKYMMTDGHGRSGRRATKEWRRENRDYNSEARKARAGAVSPGVFNSITMFGQNKIPVRSRYAGANEIGTSTDPLSNWSSSILGSQSVRQDTAIEGAVRREAREYRGVREPGRQPTLSPDDALKSFAGSLGGFSKIKGKSKKGKSSGGLDGLNKMLRGF